MLVFVCISIWAAECEMNPSAKKAFEHWRPLGDLHSVVPSDLQTMMNWRENNEYLTPTVRRSSSGCVQFAVMVWVCLTRKGH